jgi:hypothetical protein
MTEAEYWRLTWEIGGLVAVIGIGGYLFAWLGARRFDRKYGPDSKDHHPAE